jgi:cytochrome c-type biogenesis protein CcmF
MAEIGTFTLLAGLVVCAYGVAAGVVGARTGDHRFIEAALRSVRAWAALMALAAGVLLTALIARNFGLEFVASVTSRDLPFVYTVAAFWGGHAGSLLLWALILGLYGVGALRALRPYPQFRAPVALVVLITAGFFTSLLAFTSNPFTVLQVPAPDGRGLNPLLRNPWMAIHPPTLYLGFVGMTIPFALAIAGLLTGLTREWIKLARRWVMIAWMFLTLGLLFGAKWSYVVLGWGGYWAWDPVENAALMPWLTSTAFLHSIQVQERRGLLVGWNVSLMIISFALAIFGTFLTRSGVLSSVHAFANSAIGIYFLVFLACILAGSFGLLFLKWDRLREGGSLESLVSRESAFLLNNLVLVAAAFVVFTGTIFPVIAEAVTGDRINVGPPYFNQVMAPLVILLLLLMGVVPLLAWRKGDTQAFGRMISAPAALAILTALGLAAAGVHSPGTVAVVGLSVFVLTAIGVELLQGVRVLRTHGESAPAALGRLIAHNRRRYGGYVVHLGMLLILAGVTISSALATQVQVTLRPGEEARLGFYTLRYADVQAWRLPGLRVTSASVSVAAGDRALGEMRPQHHYHEAQDQATSEVALRSTWRDDLYLVLVGVSGDRRATFRVILNPFVTWIWFGGGIMLIGTLIALAPAVQRREVPAVQRDLPVQRGIEAHGSIGGGST